MITRKSFLKRLRRLRRRKQRNKTLVDMANLLKIELSAAQRMVLETFDEMRATGKDINTIRIWVGSRPHVFRRENRSCSQEKVS